MSKSTGILVSFLFCGLADMAAAQSISVSEILGGCGPSLVKGCTRSLDAVTLKCKLDCGSIVGMTGGASSGGGGTGTGTGTGTGGGGTGPAPGGTNSSEVEASLVRQTIKYGTDMQRLRVADWLATPPIARIQGPEPKAIPENNLTPELRSILSTIRKGSEKDRAAIADKLFPPAK